MLAFSHIKHQIIWWNNGLQILEYMYQNCSKTTPKTPPKCSQMAPWDPLWTTSQSWDPSWTFFHDILEHPGEPWGSQNRRKIEKTPLKNTSRIDTWKHIENLWFLEPPQPSGSSWDSSESSILTCPVHPQKVTKMTPKYLPFWSSGAPKSPKSGPQGPPERDEKHDEKKRLQKVKFRNLS